MTKKRKTDTIMLSDLKLNKSNPRNITQANLDKLKDSIENFKKMLDIRPIIVDEKMIVLGGNMRVQALRALDYKEIPESWVKVVTGLTAKQKQEFIIKDNVSFGRWDFDILANEFDCNDLDEWGFDDFDFNPEPITLDDIDEVKEISEGVKFSIECDDEDQLDELKEKLGTEKKKMSYDDFIDKLGRVN